MKARAAELREKLSNVREQKWALIKEYNDMKKKATEKENKVVVKVAAAVLENNAKQEEVCSVHRLVFGKTIDKSHLIR